MEPERFEKKSEEIAEATRRYLTNRWQRWAAIWLFILPDLLAVLACAILIRYLIPALFGLLSPYPPPETTPWPLVLLLLVGLAIYAVTSRRLHQALLAHLRHQPAVAIAPASPSRPGRHRWMWSLLSFLPLTILLMLPFLERASPREQLLAATVCFTAYFVAQAVGHRVVWGPGQADPFPFVILGLITTYSLGVFLGLPAPALLLAPDAILARALLPLGLFFVLWFLSSGIYNQIQFRRLQHLVAETPDEGGE